MAHVPPHVARLAGAPAAHSRSIHRHCPRRLGRLLIAALRVLAGYAETRRSFGNVAHGEERLRVPFPRVASDLVDRARPPRR